MATRNCHKVFCALFVLSALTACQTGTMSSGGSALTESSSPKVGAEFARTIESFSAGDSEYSGLYNNFEYKATILNSVTRNAILQQLANYYQWDEAKLAQEREKSLQQMASETEIFLSFFTPVRQNDNLTDTKSIWKVYLEAGGRRYTGMPKKNRTLLAELQSLYPYHTRWNTPYTVTFPVPTTAVETMELTITVTGPLGTRSITIPPVR